MLNDKRNPGIINYIHFTFSHTIITVKDYVAF